MVRWFCIFVVNCYAKLFYRHKVYGVENLIPGGALMASNHASYLDPPLLGISCPQVVHFLARKSLFRFKPFAWLIRSLNTHPVVRGGGNVETFKVTLKLLMSGKKVAIFPEGSRTRDGELCRGLQGVGMLVMRANCPVIPIYIHGTYAIWNIHDRFPKIGGHTACVFGKPLNFSELEGREAKQQIADEIMEAIGRLKSWYLQGAVGTPP